MKSAPHLQLNACGVVNSFGYFVMGILEIKTHLFHEFREILILQISRFGHSFTFYPL